MNVHNILKQHKFRSRHPACIEVEAIIKNILSKDFYAIKISYNPTSVWN